MPASSATAAAPSNACQAFSRRRPLAGASVGAPACAVIATGAGNFDNRNGGLYAKGQVNVTGNNFDNSGDNDGPHG